MATRVTYQGMPCIEYSGNRTLGFGTDTYSVVIPWPVKSGAIRVAQHPNGEFGESGFIAERRFSTEPRLAQGQQQRAAWQDHAVEPIVLPTVLRNRGALIAHHDPEPGMPVVPDHVLPNLFIRPDSGARLESRDELGEMHTYRLELVDIRFFWGDRGVIAGDFNIPSEAPGETFYDATKFHGGPWTVQAFAQLCLLAMPGRCTLRSVDPPEIGLQPISARSLRIDDPALALKSVVEEAGLVLSLTPDDHVRLSVLGAGREGHGIGNLTEIDPALVISRIESQSYSYPPKQVWVVGGPTEITVRVTDWEPVGLDRDGQLVNAFEAATSLGLADNLKLKRLPLMGERGRHAFAEKSGLSHSVVEQMYDWAGKWFRLVGADTVNAGLLPILDRIETNADGVRRQPLVEARRYVEQRLTRAEIRDKGPWHEAPTDEELETLTPNQVRARASATQVRQAVARAGYVLDESVAGTTDRPETSIGAQAIREMGGDPYEVLVRPLGEQKGDTESQAASFFLPVAAINDMLYVYNRENGDVRLANSLGAVGHRPDRRPITAIRNVERKPIDGVRIDRNSGVLKFDRPIGFVRPVSGPNTQTDLERYILDFDQPGIVLTYGVELKPSLRSAALTGGSYFVAAFELGENGVVRRARPQAASFPRRVVHPELVLRVALDETSNIADLNNKAKILAINHYKRPQEVSGADVEVAAALSIETNGLVTAVQWMVDDVARTSYRTGSMAGIRGAPGAARNANPSGANTVGGSLSRVSPGGAQQSSLEAQGLTRASFAALAAAYGGGRP